MWKYFSVLDKRSQYKNIYNRSLRFNINEVNSDLMHHGIQRQILVCATSFCVLRWFCLSHSSCLACKKWSNHGSMVYVCVCVCVHGPVILSLKECRSIKHMRNNPHHYCAVFLTWLLLYIVVVFHYLNTCFLCVNLRLSVQCYLLSFPRTCTPLCISSRQLKISETLALHIQSG